MLDVIRFFNGGDKFTDKFIYTKPDTDFREENGVAYWSVTAGKEDFFTVPFEIETGEGTYRVSIHKEITERYGKRGVIRIDGNAKAAFEENPDDPRLAFVAVDEESARAKGIKIWKEYLRQEIDNFEHENQRRVTERGLAPLRPNGFVAHAYDVLGLKSAAEEKYSTAALHKSEVDILKEQLDKQQKLIDKLIAGQSTDKDQSAAQPDPAEPVGAGKHKGTK